MAFVNLDDLHGTIETIAFESTYGRYEQYLIEDNIVLIEGRLSIREDEPTKIIVFSVKELTSEDEIKSLDIDITNYSEEQKENLRKIIRYYSKFEDLNCEISVTVNGENRPCGKILLNDESMEKIKNI